MLVPPVNSHTLLKRKRKRKKLIQARPGLSVRAEDSKRDHKKILHFVLILDLLLCFRFWRLRNALLIHKELAKGVITSRWRCPRWDSALTTPANRYRVLPYPSKTFLCQHPAHMVTFDTEMQKKKTYFCLTLQHLS